MNPAMAPKLTEPQLRYSLHDAMERLLVEYARYWSECRLADNRLRDPAHVERYTERLVRRLSALGLDIRLYSTWEFLAESFKDAELSCRWIIPSTINEFLNDDDYSIEEHARLRKAWEEERPSIATFNREIAEFFEYPHSRFIKEALDDLNEKRYADA